MKTRLFIVAILTIALSVKSEGQPVPDYAVRQYKFSSMMKNGVALIYGSNPGGAPNRNFFYLTGLEDTSRVLIINALDISFEGSESQLTVKGSFPVIDRASLEDYIQKLKKGVGSVWATAGDMPRVRSLAWGSDTGSGFVQADPLFYRLRELKDKAETGYLEKAIDITAESYNFMLGYLLPGYTEQHIIDTFRKKQAELGAAGTSFIQAGSGVNGTQIHARPTEKVIEKGDLVVFDVGAWYNGYTSDISRTYPASGKFTKPQKVIYQLVLDAQKAAIEKMVPGAVMKDVQNVTEGVLLEGLLKLGLITDINSPWQRSLYIVHGYYHYIGLEVHDLYNYMSRETATKKYEPGMIMTIEPGLYFPPDLLDRKPARARDLSDEEFSAFVTATRRNFEKYRNIGVRIEDDILIVEGGNRVLSASTPKEIKDVEKAMAGHR